MTHFFRFALVLVALTVLGCGDDEKKSSPYESGLGDTNTPVRTLGDDDKQQICRTLDAHLDVTIKFDELTRLACLPGAILLGGSREGCEARLSDCVKNTPEPVRVQASAQDQRVCFDSLAQCDASVAALEGCVNVSLDRALDFLESVSCSGYDDEAARAAAQAMQTAQACSDISASCSGFDLFL